MEGFGLKEDSVAKCAEEGVKLLITLDCGITDVEEVEHAKNLGMEVIITDHHLPGEKLPNAFYPNRFSNGDFNCLLLPLLFGKQCLFGRFLQRQSCVFYRHGRKIAE